MGLMDALRAKFGRKVSPEDQKNLDALDEQERVEKIRLRAKAQAEKQQKSLTWSGATYADRVKRAVGEAEK